jgi:hypothetical protein
MAGRRQPVCLAHVVDVDVVPGDVRVDQGREVPVEPPEHERGQQTVRLLERPIHRVEPDRAIRRPWRCAVSRQNGVAEALVIAYALLGSSHSVSAGA